MSGPLGWLTGPAADPGRGRSPRRVSGARPVAHVRRGPAARRAAGSAVSPATRPAAGVGDADGVHVLDSPGPAAPAGTGPDRDGEPGAEPQPATMTAATAAAQRDTRADPAGLAPVRSHGARWLPRCACPHFMTRPGTYQAAQRTVTNGSGAASTSVCTRRSVCLPCVHGPARGP